MNRMLSACCLLVGVLTAQTSVAQAASRMLPASQLLDCAAPKQYVWDLTKYDPALRRIDDGPVADRIIVRARFDCAPINKPLLAFNFYTLTPDGGDEYDRQYKAYASPRVTDEAKAPAVVMYLEGSEILDLRAPASQAGASGGVNMPWAHDTASMPYYPNGRALHGMIEANIDRYFAMLSVKRKAIGDSGYFGFQQCLFDCEALFSKVDRNRAGETDTRIQTRQVSKVQAPVVVLHVKAPQEEILRQAAALEAAFQNAKGSRLVYAGRTAADTLTESKDGPTPGLIQKRHWIDATYAIAVSDPKDAEAVLASKSVQDLKAKSEVFLALAYR